MLLLLLLHGGWDTIFMALLFWFVVIGAPIAVFSAVALAIVRRYRRRRNMS